MRRRNGLVAAVFLLPSLVTLLAFWIGPMLGTAWVSLLDWSLIGEPSFVGRGGQQPFPGTVCGRLS